MATPDAENNHAPQDVNSNDNMILSNATNKYDITINNNNNNNNSKNIEIQVPDSRCEKSEFFMGSEKTAAKPFMRIYWQSISVFFCE